MRPSHTRYSTGKNALMQKETIKAAQYVRP
jgi:hypothetical protein